jgi:transposase
VERQREKESGEANLVEVTERSEAERSEGERSVGTGTKFARSSSGGAEGSPAGVPDPEVPATPKRRRYSAEYKLEILRKADACKEPGELGALLRREGLYHSNLITWRRQREEGALNALRPKKRGRKASPKNPLAPRVAELEREKRRLERRLKQAETIIEIQKKTSELLGIPLNQPSNEGND